MILESIRIGLIGVGQRGMKTLERYAFIRHAQVCAVADTHEERLTMANNLLKEQGREAAKEYSGKHAWKKMCEAKDINLIYICTDWSSHTQMAVYAMKQGKDVAVEVPAATTVEECWQLVDTAEQTGRHCFMTLVSPVVNAGITSTDGLFITIITWVRRWFQPYSGA